MKYTAPLDDIRFSLYDINQFEEHYSSNDIEVDLDKDLIDAILEAAAKFSEDILSPINASGDKEGVSLIDGKVKTPSGYKEAYQEFVSAEWPSLAQPEKFGGQGLPYSLSLAVWEMWHSANQSWCMYPALCNGMVATLLNHGSEEDQQRFLPKIISGEWTATMCLTEAHSGSDLGMLRTKAEPQGNGSYRITGSKIFISGGDHDMADNILHLVLARLPDAPVGSRGVSLFVVPKIRVGIDGNLLDANLISCGAIEEKMGLKGSATCVMNFDGAEGFLVGPANKGLGCMFTFINASRLSVAQQAQGQTEAALQTSLLYAKERLQGRAPRSEHRGDGPADPLVTQPDIVRMLMTQKVFAEGGRAMIHYCGKQIDLSKSSNSEVNQAAQNRLALLTPIAKGCLSEWGSEATNLAMQVLGGHGYMKEWGIEQRVRDVRITQIYEGTNGIQGMDLLARKVLAGRESVFEPFVADIKQFANDSITKLEDDYIEVLLGQLLHRVTDWQSLTLQVAIRAKDDPSYTSAVAFDYLMYSGYVSLAYFWAKTAVTVTVKGQENCNVYLDKRNSAKFYFDKVLPRLSALEESINADQESIFKAISVF